MSASITIDGITKVFNALGKGETVTALDDVSLDVAAGEFVSLLGTSGCGKSTLLRIVAGLEQPTQGDARFNGEAIVGTDPARGMVFQDHSLFNWLTVRNNIKFAMKATHCYEQHHGSIDAWLELAGLADFGGHYPHQLSGGMQQRAALVRSLCVNPEVLLLDEPLGALDSLTRMNLQDELIRLWQERGTTMIMVTHDIDEAIYLSQRVVVMSPRPGRIQKIIEVPMRYPRNRGSDEFSLLRTKILQIMEFAHEEQIEYSL